MKIGFIGLGFMGEPMARNLMAKGHELYVYNRSKTKAEALVQEGAIWCPDLSALTEAAQAVITIVGTPQDVASLYLGEEGLLNLAVPQTLLLDMTTSSPELAKKIFAASLEKGLKFLDAPVTGGVGGARAGTLTIFSGGLKPHYEEAVPILKAMGENIIYMGESGNGQKAKLANQIAISGIVSGMMEALSFAQQSGLDLKVLVDSLLTGGASSRQLAKMGPQIISQDLEPGFMIKHFVKDLQVALDEAALIDLSLGGLELVHRNYTELMARGLEEKGTQALFQLYEK